MEDFSIIFEDDLIESPDLSIESGKDKNIVDLSVVSPVTSEKEEQTEPELEQEHKPFDRTKSEDVLDVKAKPEGQTTDKDEESITHKYYKFMKESNLLLVPDDFEFDGSTEKLEEAHETTLASMQQMAFSAIMERLPEQLQSAVQYTLKGGTDLEGFLKRENGFNVDTESGQIAIIKHYYKTTANWDDAKIERYLTKVDEQEIASEAASIKEELDELEAEGRKQKVLAQQEAEKAMAEQQKAVQTKISDTIVQAGFIEDKRKSPLKNFIFNAVRKEDGKATDFQRVLNQIQTNPEHLVQLADLLMDYDSKKGLKYERFQKKATTKVTEDLKSKLEQVVSKKISSIGETKEIDWTKFLS